MPIEINDRNLKIWSTIGPRATFGTSALEFVKDYKDMMILTCDVSTSAGLDRFRKSYSDNYLDIGIAEQNMIGIAAGLASEGYNVVTTTFAPFQVARCCEQIKVNAGYMRQKITMVGIASGLILGNLGFTHCCIEDIGILRSIPNIQIISPSDSLETIKAFEACLKSNTSSYIRLTGGSNNPIINKKDYDFKIGKSIKLLNGSDVTIFCNGAIVDECIKSANILKNKNIDTSVINMHTIKPIDEEIILEQAKKTRLIVSVEEHNVIGGLGSAISECIIKQKDSPPLLRLGIDDNYSKGGSYSYLKNLYGLTSEKIVDNIQKKMNE
tara:strand:- start:2613 stop:3587 length:975 start_codon:yes stop_codon:yes gene_type:complete